jgi:hypothetical protein
MTSATFSRHCFAIAIGAIVSIAAPLVGQNEPAVCAVRVASLTTGTPQGPRAREVLSCPVTGPSALAWYWSRRDRFDEIEDWIVGASGRIRDERVFRAVSAVARSDRPRADRIDALMVLARYYDYRYRPSEAFLEGDEPGPSLPRWVGIREPVVGLDPLPPDSRAQIGGIVFQLAMSDPDSGIRSAAHRLRQALAIDDPANNPLAEGAIQLVADCGREITVRSTADIGVTFDLVVPEARYRAPITIRAGSASKPAELKVVVPIGTVLARNGDHELARLTSRKSECPGSPGI